MITEKQLDCGGGSEQKVHFSVILSNKQNVWVHWNYSQTRETATICLSIIWCYKEFGDKLR